VKRDEDIIARIKEKAKKEFMVGIRNRTGATDASVSSYMYQKKGELNIECGDVVVQTDLRRDKRRGSRISG